MLFTDLSEVYDALVDWPKRLAREEPFYRNVFEQVGVRSVVDVACGSGRHANMFHDWGLRVEAADVSPAMIDLARRRFDEPLGMRWVVRGFDQPIASAPFDAAVCVGNSLALAGSPEKAAAGVQQLLAAVRPGGVAIVHLLNLWRLPEGPCTWQVIKPATVAGRELFLVKGVHRCSSGGFVDLIVLPTGPGTSPHTESTPLLAIEAAELEQMAEKAGARSVMLYGNYQRAPYDRERSADLVMLAIK